MAFLDLLQFPQAEGDAVCACEQSRRATTFGDPPATGRSLQPKANTRRVLPVAPFLDSEEAPLSSRVAKHGSGIH